MRTFLAPYSFRLENADSHNLTGILGELIKGYKHPKSESFLEVKNIIENKKECKGFVQYGVYGEKMIVKEINTGKTSKEITKDESVIGDYFFKFHFLNNYKGYVILQRRGTVGIRSIIANGINQTFKKVRMENSKIVFEPIVLGLRDIINQPVRKITIETGMIPKEVDNKLKLDNVEGLKYEMIISAKKNSSIYSKVIDTIKKQIKNKEQINIGKIINEKENIKIKFGSGKNNRTVNVTNGFYRTWIEIDKKDNLEILDQESSNLISEIIKEFRNAENN